MFFHYDQVEGEPRFGGLPWDPFKAIVGPRPIGWISTISPDGVVNLAPYSYYNAIADRPNQVYFASSARKDSQRNAEATGAFVCNLASVALQDAMNGSSVAVGPEVSEPELIRLEMAPSRIVRPPRVASAPAALECVYLDTYVCKTRDGRTHGAEIVFGEVVGGLRRRRVRRRGRQGRHRSDAPRRTARLRRVLRCRPRVPDGAPGCEHVRLHLVARAGAADVGAGRRPRPDGSMASCERDVTSSCCADRWSQTTLGQALPPRRTTVAPSAESDTCASTSW